MTPKDICKHYRELLTNSSCEAGVEYGDFAKPGDGNLLKLLPCFKNPNNVFCKMREAPTPEDLAEQENWLAEFYKQMRVARKAILAHANNSVGAGSIKCTACDDGFLAYRVNDPGPYSKEQGSGFHVHAKCSTDNCLSWLE